MKILGFMGWASHDPAAAIICADKDGTFRYCTIAEERLSRVKYSYYFPIRAIRYCMDSLGIASLDEIDLVVNDWSQSQLGFLSNDSYRCLEFDYIRKNFKVDKKKIHIAPSHHLAHAYTAFIPSGFDEAAILVVDAIGSELNGTTLYHGKGTKITPIESSNSFSIGKLYDAVTRRLLNFNVGEDGKTMGLAAFGEKYPDHPPILNINGNYRGLEIDYSNFMRRIPDNRITNDNIKVCREKQQLYEPYFSRIAFEVQEEAEKAMLHLARYATEKTGCRHLCIAGGVGLNCVANEKIHQSGLFDAVFVQPAASDVGVPFGLALYGYYSRHPESTYRPTFKNAYVGRKYSDEEVLSVLKQFKIPYRITDNDEVARLLSEKNIIGWYTGGSEFGPRALGHRSILADPRHADIKRLLNEKVKHRELYRPFAPSVMEEYGNEYFDLGREASPFMLRAPNIPTAKRDIIPAVVHVDGSGRVQTVSRNNCPEYYDLIAAFHRLTGVPVVLNTSFNDNNEPIVETPVDSLLCFMRTNIDYVVFNSKYLIKKTEIHEPKEEIKIIDSFRQEGLRKTYKRLLGEFVGTYSVGEMKKYLRLRRDLAAHYKQRRSYEKLYDTLRRHSEIQYVGDAYHLNLIRTINRELFNETHICKQHIVDDTPACKQEIFEAIRKMSQNLPIIIGLYNVSEHIRAEFESQSDVIVIYDSFNIHLENIADVQMESVVSFEGIEDYSCEYNGVKDFDRLFK